MSFALWTYTMRQTKEKRTISQSRGLRNRSANCLVLVCSRSIKAQPFSTSFWTTNIIKLTNFWDETIMFPWVSAVAAPEWFLSGRKPPWNGRHPDCTLVRGERQQFKWGFLSTSCLFSSPEAWRGPDNFSLIEKMLFRGAYGHRDPQDYLIRWRGYNAVISITKSC